MPIEAFDAFASALARLPSKRQLPGELAAVPQRQLVGNHLTTRRVADVITASLTA